MEGAGAIQQAHVPLRLYLRQHELNRFLLPERYISRINFKTMARLAQRDGQLLHKYLQEVSALAPSLRQELAKRILQSLKEKQIVTNRNTHAGLFRHLAG